MSGENVNADKVVRECVLSVGDSWIICNSKSRPGYKYYFNTLTGEAAWNLSTDEIEKAKTFTKAIPLAEIEKCPEPLEPPTMTPITPRQIYNKQIINNRFPSNNTMFPINLFNNGLPLTGVGEFNPVVWDKHPLNNAAMPQPQLIYVVQSPILQTSQEYVHNVQNYQNHNLNRGMHTFNRVNRKYDWREDIPLERNVCTNQNWNSRNLDLRQKIGRKRSKSQSYDSGSYEEDVRSWKDFHQDGNSRNNLVRQTKSHFPDDAIKESPSKYDLSALMHLKPNLDSSRWFIVVDTEVILHNFLFLNNLADADQNCFLFVPDHVMTELHRLASGGDAPTRRIFRFLSEQIDCELAFRGEVVTNTAYTDADKTYVTCVDLAQQDNVILLSNDIQLYKYKNNMNNIHLLTVKELKLLLNNRPMKQSHTWERGKSPTLDIKITVPNDKKGVPVEVRPKTPDFAVPRKIAKRPEISNKAGSVPILPNTITDTGVQASCSLTDKAEHTPVLPESGKNKSPDDIKFRRRDINILKSSSKPQANAEGNTQKKYRWRKRRGVDRKETTESKEGTDNKASTNDKPITNNTSPVTNDVIARGIAVEKQYKAASLDSHKDQETNKSGLIASSLSRDPSVERSSVSSYFKPVMPERPNIVIEETSTSGVISNTNESVESLNSMSYLKEKIVKKLRKPEMLEIAGQSMEEVLRVRRDEWVLRFVQVMEEILREKLQDNSQYACKDYAAPVKDLPELAGCIIKKFCNCFNVVDAANRLSFTLQGLKDSKGNISANIEPEDYMEMYSYGVYLIETLQDVFEDCEDLKTAHGNLKKLMYDIQNANLDFSHNDTFVDELHDHTINVTEPISIEELPQSNSGVDSPKETNQDKQSDRQSSRSSYQLRSCNKPTSQMHDLPQQNNATNIETTFFSCLNLEKNMNTNKSLTRTFNLQTSLENKSESAKGFALTPTRVALSPIQRQDLPKRQLEAHVLHTSKTSSSNGNVQIDSPKNSSSPLPVQSVVRNFTSIPLFEDKFKNGQLTKDDEEEEYENEDEDENYDNKLYTHEYNDENEIEDGEIIESDEQEIIKSESQLKMSKESDETFRLHMREFVMEIRDTIEDVKKLCFDSEQEFRNSKQCSAATKNKLKESSDVMFRLSNLLESILDRESNESDDNISLILEKANMQGVPSEDLRLQYTDLIAKCKDQVYNYYTAVTKLVETINPAHI